MASADFSADLKSIAVATTENTVRVYNIGQDSIKNGPLEKCNILRGHSGAVTGVSYSPCRRFLLSSSVDTTGSLPLTSSSLFPSSPPSSFPARLWSLETRQNLATYKFHSFPVWDVQFRFLSSLPPFLFPKTEHISNFFFSFSALEVIFLPQLHMIVQLCYGQPTLLLQGGYLLVICLMLRYVRVRVGLCLYGVAFSRRSDLMFSPPSFIPSPLPFLHTDHAILSQL